MSKSDTRNREEHGRDETLSFILKVSHWPRWPWLPVKRRLPGGAWPDLGLMHADDVAAKQWKVYAMTLFETGGVQRADAKREDHATLEALYDAGWRVD